MTDQRYYVLCTHELRWVIKREPFESISLERNCLQQKWMQYPLNKNGVPIEEGATIQWRDVPFVEEESDESEE